MDLIEAVMLLRLPAEADLAFYVLGGERYGDLRYQV